MKTFLSIAFVSIITALMSVQAASQNTSLKSTTKPIYKVVLLSEVKWEQLNPLRGDKSPKAGTLWGDRTAPGPAGFLLKPIDGFRSPPHIHNIAYRGVVIRGLIHNDDPNAEYMWMPKGSFWTQPAGGVHITAAKGSNTLAYIEVEDGFSVLPAKDAFQNKEKPINVDVSNIVWLDASDLSRIDQSGRTTSTHKPKIAFLWGKPEEGQLNGTLIKLPAGFTGKMRSLGSVFRSVVIQGRPKHRVPGTTNAKVLEPGSYFWSKGKPAVHQISCETGTECIFYVRVKGKYEIITHSKSSTAK